VVEETDEFVIMIPGGTEWSWGGVNPPCQRTGGERALMSLVHVLVLPKERIYNAVTLKPHHLPLIERMQSAGEAAVRRLLGGDRETPYSGVWMASGGYDSLPSPHLEPGEAEIQSTDLSKGGRPVGVISAFHVAPLKSQDWLHMHVFSSTWATDGFDLHGHKNTPVADVCEVLRSESASNTT
jgi:hypothetical protein